MSDTGFGAVFARRAAISFFICVVLFFSCILRVAVSALTDYSAVLNRQSGYRLTVGKLRGTIYDRNMVPLTNAESKIIAAVSRSSCRTKTRRPRFSARLTRSR